MQLIENQLVGLFASPKFHPVTCANPKPWLITEFKIEYRDCQNTILWIRNTNSMWFRADQCIIGIKEELNDI